MKKILTILSIALLGVTACTLHEQPEPVQQDGTVTFVMGLEFPDASVATRGAMGHQPIIDDIHVAVFGGEGYLNDYVKAVPCDAAGKEKASFENIQNGVLFYYKVTLLATTSARTVHVIANGPKSINYNTYDYEVMPNLTTDAGQGAYWTMFSLPHGTSVKGTKGYDEPSEEAKAAFSKLKLIRNFAEVTVTENLSNFELLGYKVFNTPNKGRIVTWKADYILYEIDKETGEPKIDEETGEKVVNRRLTGYYTPYVGAKDNPLTPEVDESTSPMTFSALRNVYSPTLAQGVSIDGTVPTSEMQYKNESQYVFEREETNGSNRPYIILKGKFNNGNPSFYRLDFTDKNGNYIPIFRNFKYDIVIGSVAKDGVSNPAQAQPSNANVSALISTHSLTDLADGQSRILVQYLDKTFMGDEGSVRFKYRYMKKASATEISESTVSTASFRVLTNTELSKITIDEEGHTMPLNTEDPAFTVTNWNSTWDSTEKWYYVTLNIQSAGDLEKRTTFRITGTTDDGDLIYRDVTIHVLKKQDFDAVVNTSQSSGSAIGSIVTVDLTLPSNLPSSVFPLAIAFEDGNKRLNPNGIDMPAQVGNSIVTGKTSERSYQFVKSVSYAEYTANNVISCVFKRIATGKTTLYMENQYFNKPYSISINDSY